MRTEIEKHEKTYYVGSLGRYMTESELRLTESEKQFVAARKAPKVCEMLQTDAGSEKIAAYLQKMIATSKIMNGTNSDAMSAPMKAAFVTASLRMLSEFRTLTIAELQIAAERGMQGAYGDFLLLSVANLRKWIQSLRADSVRSRAIAKHQALTAPEPMAESDSKKTKRALAKLSRVIFSVAQRSDTLSDPQSWHLLKAEIDRIRDARLVHDLLKEHGMFLPDYEEQKRLYWQTSASEIEFGGGDIDPIQHDANSLYSKMIERWRVSITKRRLLTDFALFAMRNQEIMRKLKTIYDAI